MDDFTIGVLLLIALVIGFVLIVLKLIDEGDKTFHRALRKSNHTYVLGLRGDEDDDY